MVTRRATLAAKRCVPADLKSRSRSDHPPGLMLYVSLVTIGWVIIVLGVLAVARLGTVPRLPDLPQEYLPGSPLPEEVMCHHVDSEYTPRCSVQYLGAEIHFMFDPETRTLGHTLVPALEYNLGQLIVLWGTPSGINRTPHTLYIYWGTRSAHLYTGQLRPDSRVQFVLYEQEPKQASSWRGFGWR